MQIVHGMAMKKDPRTARTPSRRGGRLGLRLCLAGALTMLLALGTVAVEPGTSPSEADDGRTAVSTDDLQRALASGGELDDREIDRILELQHTEIETVRLVLLPVNVENRRGRLVRGLTRSDFQVWEDHVRQQIEYFSVEAQEPLAVAFLLDVSGSMRQLGKLEAAKEAVAYFVESLRPRDQFGLVCFADEQVAWVTEFTSDRERFLERLAVQEGYGQTALNDAVAETPRLVFADDIEKKKAIVLITDGVDNVSRLSAEEAIGAAQRVSVPIYTIGFSSIPRSVSGRGEVTYNVEVMRRFSEETGGALYVVRDPDELKEAAAQIDEELRYQYLIGYYPKRKLWDGTYRTVKLETRNRRHVVRTRKGYFAEPSGTVP
jgi:Ca-activated chloride channel family protein